MANKCSTMCINLNVYSPPHVEKPKIKTFFEKRGKLGDLQEEMYCRVVNVDSVGASLLYLACKYDHEAIVKHLLTRPALAVNQAKRDGATPLYIACQKGHEVIVKHLLTHPDLAVDQTRIDGTTPLHMACQRGDEAIVKLLCQHKANPFLESAFGTPLSIARRKGWRNIVDYLENTLPYKLSMCKVS